MKILLCTNTFDHVYHGPAKFANLVLAINHRYPEHQLRILTEDVAQPTPDVYRLNMRMPAFLQPVSQLLRMFIYHREARRIRREFAYDVLVYNNAFIGLWSAVVSRQPTIGMINDDNNLRASWQNFRPNGSWLKHFLFKQLERWSTRFHTRIIANSDYLTQQIRQAYRLPAHRVVRLYKAIDLKPMDDTPRRWKTPIKILFVKADFMRCGLPVLADALGRLRDYPFALTIIGPNARFRSQVMAFFTGKSNIRIAFLGEQPPSVVQQYMQTDDVFCVPSHHEALGVANIEALAAGISVISTDAGGIPEVMDNGNNGWLVRPGDAAELAEAIQDCITSPEKRMEKANNGRRFIERFSKERMLENFLHVVGAKVYA